VQALEAQQRAIAARLGAPPELFMEGLERMLDIRDRHSLSAAGH